MKLLFLGLDGMDPGIVSGLTAADRLPAIRSIGRTGVLGRIRSTIPPATFPAWATCLTGVGPGRHGVLDFARVDGYSVRFGSRRAAAPTFLERMAAGGLRVGSIGFPGRFGAEGLAFDVAGWNAPLETAAGAAHVRPAGLHGRILETLGGRALRFAAADECAGGAAGWHDDLATRLAGAVRARTELALWLVSEIPVDVLAVHYQAPDTAGHHLVDEPAAVGRVYGAVDEAVGILLGALGPDAVLAAADHGMGPTSDVVVSLNALLVRGGFLSARRSSARAAAGRVLRRAGLYALPASLRSLILRAAGPAVPDRIESAGRYGRIDMAGTAAFSDELTYAPSVRLNVRGREPLGTVPPEDRLRVAAGVAAFLRGVARPGGGPLFEAVIMREEAYDGPFAAEAPDVLLRLAPDGDGRTPSLCPPHLRPAMGDDWWIPVPPAERAGRKGGILRGSHRPWGVFAASPAPPGLADRGEPELRDVAAMACAAVGVGMPRTVSKPAAGDDGLTESERAAVAGRLAALGYVDGAWG